MLSLVRSWPRGWAQAGPSCGSGLQLRPPGCPRSRAGHPPTPQHEGPAPKGCANPPPVWVPGQGEEGSRPLPVRVPPRDPGPHAPTCTPAARPAHLSPARLPVSCPAPPTPVGTSDTGTAPAFGDLFSVSDPEAVGVAQWGAQGLCQGPTELRVSVGSRRRSSSWWTAPRTSTTTAARGTSPLRGDLGWAQPVPGVGREGHLTCPGSLGHRVSPDTPHARDQPGPRGAAVRELRPAGPPATSVCASRRGLPSQAFEYIRYNKGIMGEDTYPYKGKVTPRASPTRTLPPHPFLRPGPPLRPERGTLCLFRATPPPPLFFFL